MIWSGGVLSGGLRWFVVAFSFVYHDFILLFIALVWFIHVIKVAPQCTSEV